MWHSKIVGRLPALHLNAPQVLFQALIHKRLVTLAGALQVIHEVLRWRFGWVLWLGLHFRGSGVGGGRQRTAARQSARQAEVAGVPFWGRRQANALGVVPLSFPQVPLLRSQPFRQQLSPRPEYLTSAAAVVPALCCRRCWWSRLTVALWLVGEILVMLLMVLLTVLMKTLKRRRTGFLPVGGCEHRGRP